MVQEKTVSGTLADVVILSPSTTHTDSKESNGAVNLHPDEVDYWTATLRYNLSVVRAVKKADNEDKNSPSAFQIDEEILEAPRRKSARDALAQEVAVRLYPAPSDSIAPIIKYEKDIVMLRSVVLDQRRSAITKATERKARHNWIQLISRQGPWDEANDPLPLSGAPSLPMPVEQSDKDSLAPFFAHLAADGTHGQSNASLNAEKGIAGVEPYHGTELIEFEKGVLYADGRVDLCKMATGPRNIQDLMDSLKSNTFSKHFLLGNNIIGPTGAKAIARFIHEYPNRFETWYLAGNCIDTHGLTVLVDSMVKSSTITNVWLKRNPLGGDAVKDIFRLVTKTRNLRTLDLDQTNLGDTGVANLFGLLAGHVQSQQAALRHIYLNACGIGEKACFRISQYLQSSECTIESLYISNNPIGNAATVLANGLRANKSLKRVVLQSCGLKDEGIIALAEALKHNGGITVFDVGQSYATGDLGMRYNWITAESVKSLVDLIRKTKLQYLNVSYTSTSQSSLNKILEAITKSHSLVWVHMKPLVTGTNDAASVKAGQEYTRLHKLMRERLHENVNAQYGMDYERFENEHKRSLVSPADVRFIDSVYRNRDASAARRGLKKLEKWWGEDDKTLQRVRDGTLT